MTDNGMTGNRAVNALLITLGIFASCLLFLIILSNIFVDIHNYRAMEFFEKQYRIKMTPYQKLMVCWKCQAKGWDYPDLEKMLKGWGLNTHAGDEWVQPRDYRCD
jgi:hypothetical protein